MQDKVRNAQNTAAVDHTRESEIPSFSLSSAGIEAWVITLLQQKKKSSADTN
ncbi:hypothetical protein GBAR_LOCUS29300 [Geodia barretti]|uniref:Uncharacterized protein n=1 Tax=Geodia barretti TaxID=519541 RepID=A0AA35XJS7_GEOBA|nr:hypothetical protein GBAR_LOCUS29300 [Geodia barretti]